MEQLIKEISLLCEILSLVTCFCLKWNIFLTMRFSHNYHSEGEDPGVGDTVWSLARLQWNVSLNIKPLSSIGAREEVLEFARTSYSLLL